MMDLKTSKAKRGVIRGKVTKLGDAFDELASEGDVKKMTVFKDKLELCLSDLTHLDCEILALLPESASLETEIETAEDYRDKVTDMISLLTFEIKNIEEKVNINKCSNNNDSVQKTYTAKLPQLKIAPFRGDSLKWQEFWDSFESMIDSDVSLTSVIKFNYLHSFLDGEAKRTIEGISVTNANYNVAIDILKERYGNKETIIFAHLDNLFSMPKANDNTKQLRCTIDECEKHMRSLEAFGSLSTDQIFAPLILSKLPQELRVSLHRKNGQKPWELSALRQHLKDEIVARELGERHFGDIENTNSNASNQKYRPKGTAESMVSYSASKKTFGCIYCNENHFSDECLEYKDVNSRKSKLNGRCFRCLMKGHASFKCIRARPCFYCGQQTHHRSLCPTKFESVEPNRDLHENGENTCSAEALKIHATHQNVNSSVLTQTAMARIRNDSSSSSKHTWVRLILDTGANRSFISKRMANFLCLKPIWHETLSIATFGSYSSKDMECPVVEFFIEKCTDNKLLKMQASVVPKISCATKRTQLNINMFPAFSKLEMADPWTPETANCEIELLIGNDFYYELVKNERLDLSDGFVLLKTVFGWIPTGRIPIRNPDNEAQAMVILEEKNEMNDMRARIERFWNLESIGINDSASINDDDLALENFNKNIRYNEGRYEVTWPWKDANTELFQNYNLSLGRLKSLYNRLQDKPEVKRKYDEIIKDQLQKGIIEKVDMDTETFEKKHYIPHHCVLKPDKASTKLRIVYDASAKQRKDLNSLNDCLFRGPVIMEDLVGILMRFRLDKFAISCDIEKAFHQVGLQKEDRDVCRFLWLKDYNSPVSKENVDVFRFCRVPFGVVSSPFLLAATIWHHLKTNNSGFATNVLRNIYVDNILITKSSVEECRVFYENLKAIMNEASMNVRQWCSNSVEFIASIPKEDRAERTEEIVSVLGLQWNVITDELEIQSPPSFDDLNLNNTSSSVSTDSFLKTNTQTKRKVLQRISEIFDPLGFVSPVILPSKLLMQELWKEKLDWDDLLPEKQLNLWTDIQIELNKVSSIKINRNINENCESDSVYELHCFVDASEKAYAAVIYLLRKSNQEVTSQLIFSKLRLSSLKPITIPRLELLAVVIGVRILEFTERNIDLNISSKSIWSDSKCVLHWIYNRKMKPVFVENRLKEIRKHTDLDFRYIPSAENPADLPTRGLTVDQIIDSTLWWNGPSFLTKETSMWPDEWDNDNEFEIGENDLTTVFSVEIEQKIAPPFDIDIGQFSSLKRLLRVTAWCLRAIRKFRKTEFHTQDSLTAEELNEARTRWEIFTQSSNFKEEINCINKKKNQTKVNQFGLFIDNKIIRCRGRVENANLSYNEKFPKLLPKTAPFTHLLIKDIHKKLLHSGVSHTLSHIRKEYWILHGKSTVKKVLKNCFVCKKHECLPYATPPFPPLPAERLSEQTPFSCTGIDFLGPLFVKTKTDTKKVWICLFTCAVVRAIHLEIVGNMSTDEFLMALRRFSARRGYPKLIISDNAKTFKLADKTLHHAWDEIVSDPSVQDYTATFDIQWKFITEYAPWQGGFYERMVGSVKRALRKSVGNASLDMVQLQTIVTEVEAIVNSRPLTYVESNISDHKLLTPAHFLSGSLNVGFPEVIVEKDGNFKIKEDSYQNLIENWKRGQNILSNYWCSWKKDYLQQLREKNQFTCYQNENIPKLNDLVLIGDKLPRGQWKFGILQELIISNDGVVRSVKIRLPNRKIIQRPIKKLFPVERESIKSDSCSDEVPSTKGSNIKPSSEQSRPQRKAAKDACKLIDKILGRECHVNRE